MKKNIFLILFIISLTSCLDKPKSKLEKLPKPKIDTIHYSFKAFNNGIGLDLYSNNYFKFHFYSYGCTGGGAREILTGIYKKFPKQRKLILYPDTVKYYQYPINKVGYQPKIKPKVFPYYAGQYRIKTEYDIVKWGGKEYLLSPLRNKGYKGYDFGFSIRIFNCDKLYYNDYYELAEAYNDDLKSKRYLRCLSRKINEKTGQTYADLCKAVGKWQFLFLEKPIQAKVIKVKRIKEKIKNPDEKTYEVYYTYDMTLNKGYKDNVYIGLKFYEQKTGEYAIVKKVRENFCVVHSDNGYVSNGKIMSTKRKYK